MVYRLTVKKFSGVFFVLLTVTVCVCIAVSFASAQEQPAEKKYINWFEMNVSLSALEDAMELDIRTYDMLYHISWIDTLSYLACKNGNNWARYSKKDLDKMVAALGDMYTVDDLMADNKYYSFYKEAFSVALGGL